MRLKVWIVVRFLGHDGQIIEGVFSSKENAREYCECEDGFKGWSKESPDETIAENTYEWRYYIEEWEIDKGD
jgi:hypothetical protein